MNPSSTSLRWAAALFAGALVVGSGVATAVVASGDGTPSAAEVEITPSTEPTGSTLATSATTQPVVTTLAKTPTTVGSDGATTGEAEDRYWGPECGAGEATNHGQYVSSAPKGGAARSEAAQSDCGKPTSSVGDPEESDEAPEAPETSTTSGSSGNGKGRGNSK